MWTSVRRCLTLRVMLCALLRSVPARSVAQHLFCLLLTAGLLHSSGYQTDGTSFAQQLRPTPQPPTRDRLLFEYWGMGYTERGPCKNGTSPCPNGAESLEDAPSNTWAGLRIVNATHNIKYAEYRPAADSPIVPGSTNFTIAFDLAADPFELVNHGAGPSAWPAALLAQYSTELWALATCSGASCP
jgi:hypothetical protein